MAGEPTPSKATIAARVGQRRARRRAEHDSPADTPIAGAKPSVNARGDA